MKTILLSAFILCTLAGSAQNKFLNKAKDAANKATGKTAGGGLTNDEVVKGLKEALSIGSDNSAALASKADGFYKNPEIFIPWPPEAQAMKDKLIKLGYQNKVTEFETSLNRAAEEASKDAAPIFKNAVTQMSVGDGFAILRGNDTAATHYLREKTHDPLKQEFMPVVKTAIEKVKVTAYWTDMVTIYNKIPLVKKQDPDLNNYVTEKAINGLMVLIGKEEAKIRNNPAAQVTDLLKNVFGKK
jgi:hypothetical protein